MVSQKKDRQNGEKERVSLSSSFKIVVQRASRSLCGVNVDGKKKSDEEAKKEGRIGLRKSFHLRPLAELKNPISFIRLYASIRISCVKRWKATTSWLKSV
jgi:hypothetical protein